MAFTSTSSITITVKPNGVLETRNEKTVTDDTDGSQATFYKRNIFTPDMDVTTLPPRVRKIANALWDAATISAWITASSAPSP